MNKLKNILKKAINTSLIGIAASMFMPIASYAEDFGDYGIEYYSDVVVYPGYHVVIEAAPFSSRYGKTAPKVGMGWVESDKIDQEEVWNTGDTDHWSNGYGMNSVGSVGDSESKDYYYLRPKSGEPGSDFPYSKFSNEGKYLLFSSPMWWSEENQTEGMVDAYFLFKGIKGESNRKSFIVAALQDYDQGRIEWYDAEAYNFVTESGSPKIYPDSYEDYIVLTPSEIESVIPWMNYYIDQETGEYRSYLSINAKNIPANNKIKRFNRYKNIEKTCGKKIYG